MWTDRRGFFSWVGGGLATAAAASLMLRDGVLEAAQPGESDPRCPHFPHFTREPNRSRSVGYSLKSCSALPCAMRSRSAGVTGIWSRNVRASAIDP